MKRFIQAFAVLVLLLCLNSLAPLVGLYAKKDARQPTNDETAARLAGNSGDYFSFIVMGDTHSGFPFDDSATLKMARLINREDRFKGKIPIDFIAVLGDATFYSGREANYRMFDKIRSVMKWPAICAMGNHDNVGGGGKNFKKHLGSKELAFADRNSYFIVVDDKISEMSEAQFVWLESELKKSLAYRHRFLLMHRLPISLYQQSWFRPEHGAWSRRLMRLCSKYRVDIVFAGHEHMFRARTLGGVRYVISGGGGMPPQIPAADGGFLHYLVVRVYGDYVDYEVRKVFPPFWEFVTYYMWKEIFYGLKFVFFKDGPIL
jgi:predicted phosphodiesterase